MKTSIGEWQLVSLVSLASFCFSLAFLDPINWPKQIALVTVSCFVLSGSLLNAAPRPKTIYMVETSVLIGILLTWIVPQVISDAISIRFFWGVFGRNNGFITQVSLVLIAYSCYLLATNGMNVQKVLTGTFYSIFLASLYGLAQYFDVDPIPWSKKNEVFSFFGNTNFASAIFGIGVSVFLVLFFEFKRKLPIRQFVFHCFMALSIFFVLVQTNSIQGLAGVGISCALLIIRWVASSNKTKGLLLFAASLPISVLILAGLTGEGPFGTFLYQYTLRLRLYYWWTGIRMGSESPLTGVGVDSYGDFYRAYRPTEVITLTGPDLTTNNAHNSLIQIFATVGLPAFLVVSFIVLLVGILAMYLILVKVRNYRASSSLGILYICAWSMAFFSIDNISIAIWNWLLLGLLVGSFQFESEVGKTRRAKERIGSMAQYSRLISIVIASLAFGFSWYSSSPNRQLASTFSKVITSDNSALINERSAIAVDVANSGMTREAEFTYAADAFMSIGLSQKALQTLIIGTKAFPRDFEILDKLAILSEQQNLGEQVLETRLRQTNLEPNNWMLWYSLARAYLRQGDTEKTTSILTKIEESARLLADPPMEEIERIRFELGRKN